MRTDVAAKLNAVVSWLSFQSDDLVFGLRSAEDALKLFDYGAAHQELPEFADDWDKQHRIDAVSYDPLG